MNGLDRNRLLSQIEELRESILRKVYSSLQGLTETSTPSWSAAGGYTTARREAPAHVYDLGEEVVAVLEIPGLQRREDIHFTVKTGGLEVRGRRARKLPDARAQAAALPAGAAEEFQQALSFPHAVRPETATAIYRHGLLEVRVKKVPFFINENVPVQFL